MKTKPTDKMTDEQIAEAAAELMGYQRLADRYSSDGKNWFWFQPLHNREDDLAVMKKYIQPLDLDGLARYLIMCSDLGRYKVGNMTRAAVATSRSKR